MSVRVYLLDMRCGYCSVRWPYLTIERTHLIKRISRQFFAYQLKVPLNRYNDRRDASG